MEDNEDKKIEERKEKIRSWLKDKYNLALIGILIFGLLIRLYYFFLTNNQTFWHDEAEYVAMAKNYLGQVDYILNPQRTFIFSGIIALFFMFNLSEQVIRLVLVILPSFALVFFVYLLGKEMFDKKIALIAALLISVSWTLLFWTARMQPDFISMCFQVLAILFMWKYWKSPKTKLIVYSAIFSSLGFQFKVSGMLVPVIFFVFILLKDRFSAFKNKDYWIFLLVFVIVLTPQLVYSYFIFKNPFALFGTTYVTTVADERPFGWNNLNYYYLLTENTFFWLFILGFFLSLNFFLYFDVLIRDKNKFLKPEIFCILLFILVSAYYIFWIKGTDDRWVFIWLPFIFFMIGKSSFFIYDYVKKYNKILALIIVLGFLTFGIYVQLNHNDGLIKIKKDTYSQVRDAAFWIKENSNKNDLIVSASYPQTVYYSEREVQYYRPTFEDNLSFNNFINLEKPKFIIVSVFEYHDQWTLDWVQENSYRLVPVQAYFSDENRNNPLLIIYEVNYSISQPTN